MPGREHSCRGQMGTCQGCRACAAHVRVVPTRSQLVPLVRVCAHCDGVEAASLAGRTS
jgi:hypothetical protein